MVIIIERTTKSSEMNLDDDISFGLQLGSRDLFDRNFVGMFEQDGIHDFWQLCGGHSVFLFTRLGRVYQDLLELMLQ